MWNERSERLRLLKEIVMKNPVSGQTELMKLMTAAGSPVTQATLSRDLKELGITKAARNGVYYYAVPESAGFDASKEAVSASAGSSLHTNSIISLEFTESLCVLHTNPSYAAMIASLVDAARLQPVAGTIAGDDTVFLAIRKGYGEEAILSALEEILPGLRQSLITK